MIEINANGSVITPHIVRSTIAEMNRAGLYSPLSVNGDGITCKMHVAHEMQLENAGLIVASTIKKGAEWDFGRGTGSVWAKTIAGIPIQSRLDMPETECRFERGGRPLAVIVNLALPRALEGATNAG